MSSSRNSVRSSSAGPRDPVPAAALLRRFRRVEAKSSTRRCAWRESGTPSAASWRMTRSTGWALMELGERVERVLARGVGGDHAQGGAHEALAKGLREPHDQLRRLPGGQGAAGAGQSLRGERLSRPSAGRGAGAGVTPGATTAPEPTLTAAGLSPRSLPRSRPPAAWGSATGAPAAAGAPLASRASPASQARRRLASAADPRPPPGRAALADGRGLGHARAVPNADTRS